MNQAPLLIRKRSWRRVEERICLTVFMTCMVTLWRYKLHQAIFFVNSSTPFNVGSVERICQDKDFAYRLFSSRIRMPKTASFLNPFVENEHAKYKIEKSIEHIVDEIGKHSTFPVIVKMNSGCQGNNVFLCRDKKEAATALKSIYNKNSRFYDYVALAQQYIKPKREYRAIFFERKALLVYEKDTSGSRFVGNLSPLHFEGAKAVHITDTQIVGAIEQFAMPIFELLPVSFGGFDIIEDEKGKLWLIEINSRPGFSYFVRDNGLEPLVLMYVTILQQLKNPSYDGSLTGKSAGKMGQVHQMKL